MNNDSKKVAKFNIAIPISHNSDDRDTHQYPRTQTSNLNNINNPMKILICRDFWLEDLIFRAFVIFSSMM